ASAELLHQEQMLQNERNIALTDLSLCDPTNKADEPKIQAAHQKLSEIDAKTRQLIEAIRRADPKLASVTYPKPLTVPQVQKLLDPGTLLLSYFVGKDGTYL